MPINIVRTYQFSTPGGGAGLPHVISVSPQPGETWIAEFIMMSDVGTPVENNTVYFDSPVPSTTWGHNVGGSAISWFGNLCTAAGGGGNGVMIDLQSYTCIDASYTTLTIDWPAGVGTGTPPEAYVFIYVLTGCFGQNASTCHYIADLDDYGAWRYAHDGSLTAFSRTMNLNPTSDNCFPCNPPCDTNNHQMQLPLSQDKDVSVGIVCIPDCYLFNVCDPCDPSYVENDFIFGLCGTGTGDAQTVTDVYTGNWIIDWQPTNSFGARQIFAHIGPAANFCGGMSSQIVGNPVIKGTAHSNHSGT